MSMRITWSSRTFNDQLAKLPKADQHSVDIGDGCEKIWVTYPSVVEGSDEYIRSQVLVELGGRNVVDPNEIHTIALYIAEMMKGLVYPSSEVVVLSPQRTFWEKATLIHVGCSRGQLRVNAERLASAHPETPVFNQFNACLVMGVELGAFQKRKATQ